MAGVGVGAAAGAGVGVGAAAGAAVAVEDGHDGSSEGKGASMTTTIIALTQL